MTDIEYKETIKEARKIVGHSCQERTIPGRLFVYLNHDKMSVKELSESSGLNTGTIKRYLYDFGFNAKKEPIYNYKQGCKVRIRELKIGDIFIKLGFMYRIECQKMGCFICTPIFLNGRKRKRRDSLEIGVNSYEIVIEVIKEKVYDY